MPKLSPFLLSCILLLAGCASAGQPKAVDPETGYIPTDPDIGPTVVKSEKSTSQNTAT